MVSSIIGLDIAHKLEGWSDIINLIKNFFNPQ